MDELMRVADVADALKRVRAFHRGTEDTLSTQLRAAVWAAKSAGYHPNAIAKAADKSRPWVYLQLKEDTTREQRCPEVSFRGSRCRREAGHGLEYTPTAGHVYGPDRILNERTLGQCRFPNEKED